MFREKIRSVFNENTDQFGVLEKVVLKIQIDLEIRKKLDLYLMKIQINFEF